MNISNNLSISFNYLIREMIKKGVLEVGKTYPILIKYWGRGLAIDLSRYDSMRVVGIASLDFIGPRTHPHRWNVRRNAGSLEVIGVSLSPQGVVITATRYVGPSEEATLFGEFS